MVCIPQEPFALQSDVYFKGKLLEQLIWEPGFITKERSLRRFARRYMSGYRYNAWLIENSPNQALASHAEQVRHAADTRIPKVKCQICGAKPAVFVEIGNNELGTVIGPNPIYLFCDSCSRHADKKVTLEFARVGDFPSEMERRWFIQTLKYVFLENEKIRISRKLAFDFLFGEPQLELF